MQEVQLGEQSFCSYLRPRALSWREGYSGSFEHKDRQASLDTFVCGLEKSGKAGSYVHESKCARELDLTNTSTLLPCPQLQPLGQEEGDPGNVPPREGDLPQSKTGRPGNPSPPPAFFPRASCLPQLLLAAHLPCSFQGAGTQDLVDAGAGVATLKWASFFSFFLMCIGVLPVFMSA